jgi:hypothetical protein
MPTLIGAAAAALDAVTVEDFDVGSDGYPYTRLSSDDFERLCYALFKRTQPPGQERFWDDVAIMVRGADARRDLVLFKGWQLSGVVQCKRLESAVVRQFEIR